MAIIVGIFVIGNITAIALVKTAARADHTLRDAIDRPVHRQHAPYAQRAIGH
jgi:hypothetical protein